VRLTAAAVTPPAAWRRIDKNLGIMLPWGFGTFIERWLEKANNYSDTDLSDVFDKFFTLFVAFGAIYQEIYQLMLEEGRFGSRRYSEEDAAVKSLSEYLGYSELAKPLRIHAEQIMYIESLIEKETFYFCVQKDHRTPDYDADRELLSDLRSDQDEIFCQAILKLLYRTRCNMFHGAKEYSEQQMGLINSMNIFLKSVVDVAMKKLDIAGSG